MIPFFSGKNRKIFMVSIAALGFINTLMIEPGTDWTYSFLGLNLVFMQADKLSLIVGYIFTFIALLGVIYSMKAKEKYLHISGFLYVGSSLGAVFAGDLFTLYVFWEIMAVSSTVVVWSRQDPEATKIGYRYLIMHIVGGLILFAGILLQYQTTGSLKITEVHAGLPMALFFFGIGINAGFIPLHTWLPDAYPAAPYAGSVFMSVFTTKTAVYMLVRTLPGVNAVAIMGSVMAVYGVSFALMQNNARKLCSYHIISQVGYMVAAVGLGGAMGINGAIFHLINHIFYKALLFMCIGSVLYSTGIEELTKLGGLTKKMPITTAAVTIAALSISGMSFFNGYVSKGLIFNAAHGNDFVYLMLELAAVGTFLSFLKLTYFGFFRKNNNIEAADPPLCMIIPMVVVAFFCVFIGVYPAFVVKALPFPAPADFHFYSLGHLLGVWGLLGVTAVIFFVYNKYYEPHDRVTQDFDFFYKRIFLGFKQFCKEPFADMSEGYDCLVSKLLVDASLPNSGPWTIGDKSVREKKAPSFLKKLWLKLVSIDPQYDAMLDTVLADKIFLKKEKVEEETNTGGSASAHWIFTACKNISSIHTGDLGVYTGWICSVLAIVLLVMIIAAG
jgi:multicomponent Na+:H+ antiporter subunit D